MEPDLLNPAKEPNALDATRLFVSLEPEKQKNLYYVMAGMKISEDMQQSGKESTQEKERK